MKKVSLNKQRAFALLHRLSDYADYMKKEAIYLEKVIKEIKKELK